MPIRTTCHGAAASDGSVYSQGRSLALLHGPSLNMKSIVFLKKSLAAGTIEIGSCSALGDLLTHIPRNRSHRASACTDPRYSCSFSVKVMYCRLTLQRGPSGILNIMLQHGWNRSRIFGISKSL